MKATALVALLIAALTFGGCEFSVGSKDEKTQLEDIIKTQLPQKIEEAGQGTITVSAVNCVEQSEGKYDCLAAVSGKTSDGEPVKENLDIAGSCDDTECIWKTK